MNIPANLQAVATALNLTFTSSNPMPGADASTALYLSADNKIAMVISNQDNKEQALGMMDHLAAGMSMVQAMGYFEVIGSTAGDMLVGFEGKAWADLLVKVGIPHAGIYTSIMKNIADHQGLEGDALNVTIATEDGFLLSLTDFAVKGDVSLKLLTGFLDGSFMTEVLKKKHANAVNALMTNPELMEDAIAFKENVPKGMKGFNAAFEEKFGSAA